MSRRQFVQIDTTTPHTAGDLADFLEPIRDSVQRSRFSPDVLERTPTFEQLIELGLVTEDQVKQLLGTS